MPTVVITLLMFFELASMPVGSFLACAAPHSNSLLSWHSLIQEYSPLALQTLFSTSDLVQHTVGSTAEHFHHDIPRLHPNKCLL